MEIQKIKKIKKNVEPKDKPEPYDRDYQKFKVENLLQKLNQNLQKIFFKICLYFSKRKSITRYNFHCQK